MGASSDAACVHLWDIEPPNGHTSPGTCRRCGESRDFLNSCEEILEQAAAGRPLDFRAPRARREEPVAKISMHKRHREITRRWPEIKAAVEELRSVNQAAKKLGYSYDAVRSICLNKGMDITPYAPGAGPRAKPVRETDGQAFRERPPANGQDHIGDLLIGAGLVMIGGWVKKREQGG